MRLQNIKKMWLKLGRQPRYVEVKAPDSQFSAGTYENRFGLWSNALKEFVEWVNRDKELEDMPDTESTEKPPKQKQRKRRTRREISDRQRFNFYSGLSLLVITVITNFLLIPQLGLLGAAIASLIAMTLFNFIKLWILGKELKIWPFSALFLKVIPVLFVCFGLIYIIQSANLALALEIMLGLVLIGLSFLILYRYSTALDDFKAILNRKSA